MSFCPKVLGSFHTDNTICYTPTSSLRLENVKIHRSSLKTCAKGNGRGVLDCRKLCCFASGGSMIFQMRGGKLKWELGRKPFFSTRGLPNTERHDLM